jgi:hypothetical protein
MHHEHVYPQFVLKTARNATNKDRCWLGEFERSVHRREKRALTRAVWPENGKGCDTGYAPAASSCERVNSVDACTVRSP